MTIKLGFCLIAAAAGFVSGSRCLAQIVPTSPADLIKYLTYQTDRPNKHGMTKGESTMFSCGPSLAEERDNRALTLSLVNMGDAAVPAIEQALDSFEAKGEASPVATEVGWLLLAYARLKGPGAYPRLHELYAEPRVAPFAAAIDSSVALAFGFTSYLSRVSAKQMYQYHICAVSDSVSSSGPAACEPGEHELPVQIIRCGAKEPRDYLDRLISAWIADRPASLQSTLGPTAKIALGQMSKDGSPATSASANGAAVGYRLRITGRWSEPPETLSDFREPTSLPEDATNVDIDTTFFDRSGNECGTLRLNFLRSPQQGVHAVFAPGLDPKIQRRFLLMTGDYLIDNQDISELLRLIATCASRGAPN
jgi:hypothetical protein